MEVGNAGRSPLTGENPIRRNFSRSDGGPLSHPPIPAEFENLPRQRQTDSAAASGRPQLKRFEDFFVAILSSRQAEFSTDP
ncbi:MAG: hypothetical protein CW346_13245 [Bacillaceae bacterium]|nr:hypothetical protein [Bacillaceae bacterium]